MRIRATAPGKLVLIGEYAVLAGAPAIVMAVPRRVVVEAEPGPQGHRVSAPDVGVHDTPLDAAGLPVVQAALAEVQSFAQARGKRLPGLSLRIDTSALSHAGQKLGLGASAAVAVAVVAAGLRAAGLETHVLPLALAAHRLAQGGRGSGVDVAACTRGGTLEYRRQGGSPVAAPLPLPQKLELFALWAGESASTVSLLDRVEALRLLQPTEHAALMATLGRHAEAGVHAAARDDGAAFLAAVVAYRAGLAALGRASGADIVSVRHRELGALVEPCSAIYKPSGAGAGDLGVAFVPTAAAASLARHLDTHAVTYFRMSVEPRGVDVTTLE